MNSIAADTRSQTGERTGGLTQCPHKALLSTYKECLKVEENSATNIFFTIEIGVKLSDENWNEAIRHIYEYIYRPNCFA
jgi:hypothetical protein